LAALSGIWSLAGAVAAMALTGQRRKNLVYLPLKVTDTSLEFNSTTTVEVTP
jgi:hypothetical protein